MRYIQIIPVLLLFIITACYDESTFHTQIDLPATPAKIIVFGYLSPENDSIRIYVGKSKSINNTGYNPQEIENAEVTLSCDGKIMKAPWYRSIMINTGYDSLWNRIPCMYYERGYKVAVRDFPLIEGKQVSLTVKTDLGTVTSSCIIPENVTVNPSISKVWMNTNSGYSDELNVNVLLGNWANTQEFFHFYAECGEYDPLFPTHGRSAFDLKSGSEFIAHKPSNSQYLNYRLNKSYYPDSDEEESKDSIYIYLAKTDEAYYKFNTTFRNFEDIDGNPFAEPIIVYSNIKGGLGVFCAYRLKKASYPLKDYIK